MPKEQNRLSYLRFVDVKKPEPKPRPIRQAPLKVTENPTTLGDLMDRFLDRLDRMRHRYE